MVAHTFKLIPISQQLLEQIVPNLLHNIILASISILITIRKLAKSDWNYAYFLYGKIPNNAGILF